jgi:hypothetical protein
LKFKEDNFLVRRINKSGERHTAKSPYVMFLVRLLPGRRTRLALERCPRVLPEHDQVWNALDVAGIVLEYDAARKQVIQLADQMALESALYMAHSSPSREKVRGVDPI